MKVVILAGGLGTRLAEETDIRPKPMVEIGGRPILWHIMKHYAYYGFKEFYIALGYKGEFIKNYFIDYYLLNCNVTVDLSTGSIQSHSRQMDDWMVHLDDTGMNTATGGRIKRLEKWLRDSTFMVTYGDGVSNIDLMRLKRFHESHGRIATVTAVRPPARFGGLNIKGRCVTGFTEKPRTGEGWINGGFFVFEPEIFEYLKEDQDSLEGDVLDVLARKGQLMAYQHDDFWQCMDTIRDKRFLESLWQSGNAPWKIWT